MIGSKAARILLFLWFGASCSSFPIQGWPQKVRLPSLYAEKDGYTNKIPNPFKDMVSKMDDIIDDFMSKRMGNGEVFYGKRKYNPSGRENTEGSYNGMGLTDKARIDMVRERKEEYLALKRAREQQLKRDK